MAISFTMVKRGYNPAEVDNYIQNLEIQLNEYKEKASAINNAIINAQLAADNIIKEATSKSEKMLSIAEKDAQNMKLNAINQVKSMKTNIAEQIKIVESFNKEYDSLIAKYLTPIKSEEISPLIVKLNSVNNLIDSFGDAVNKSELSKEPPQETPVQLNTTTNDSKKTDISKSVKQNKTVAAKSVHTPVSENISVTEKNTSVSHNPSSPKSEYADLSSAKNNLSTANSLNNNKTTSKTAPLSKKPQSEKTSSVSDNPFEKKTESVNPFVKSKNNDNFIENEIYTAASNDSLMTYDEEFSVINENTDYNSLMGEAGTGSVAAASSLDSVRPGIYKTSDLMKNSYSSSPFSNTSSENNYESGSFLSISELEELMPTPKNKKLRH